MATERPSLSILPSVGIDGSNPRERNESDDSVSTDVMKDDERCSRITPFIAGTMCLMKIFISLIPRLLSAIMYSCDSTAPMRGSRRRKREQPPEKERTETSFNTALPSNESRKRANNTAGTVRTAFIPAVTMLLTGPSLLEMTSDVKAMTREKRQDSAEIDRETTRP